MKKIFILFFILTICGFGCERRFKLEPLGKFNSNHIVSTTSTPECLTPVPDKKDDWDPNIDQTIRSYDNALSVQMRKDAHRLSWGENSLEEYGMRQVDVLYGDVTGDKKAEAIIPVPSGGTAGDIGLLIYGLKNDKVTLLDKIEGYKMGKSVEDGHLVVTFPYYLEDDANCCPSFTDRTIYNWNGKTFVEATTTRYGFKEFNEKFGKE